MKTQVVNQTRAALYMRVSTNEQNVEPQRMELREWAGRTGVQVLAEFEDKISGKKWERSGLNDLLKQVRRGSINVVLCVKLDRLGRSLNHLAQIISELDSHKCALVATSQGIDTRADSATGRLQLGVLMAVSEFERTLISERTRAGLQVARAAGKKLGRPAKKLPKNWADIVREWKAEGGRGLRTLAKRLGGLSLSTVTRLINKTEKPSS